MFSVGPAIKKNMFYKEIVTHSLIIQKLLEKHVFFFRLFYLQADWGRLCVIIGHCLCHPVWAKIITSLCSTNYSFLFFFLSYFMLFYLI